MLKKFLVGLGILFFLLLILVFRPVPIVTEDKAIEEKGIVLLIREGGEKDVVFRLADNDRIFYINRGLENGLELEELRMKMIGRKATFKYPKYWTPLDWNNRIKHLSKVEVEGEVIFNEFIR